MFRSPSGGDGASHKTKRREKRSHRRGVLRQNPFPARRAFSCHFETRARDHAASFGCFDMTCPTRLRGEVLRGKNNRLSSRLLAAARMLGTRRLCIPPSTKRRFHRRLLMPDKPDGRDAAGIGSSSIGWPGFGTKKDRRAGLTACA